jgi:hypothetical protein
MKKLLSIAIILSTTKCFAQFEASRISAGLSANYMYFFKQHIGLLGTKFDLGYRYSDKVNGYLSYTYSTPIKTKSEYSSNSSGIGSFTVPTEITTKISTVSIGGQYFFNDNPEAFSLYSPIGASLILGSYTEKSTGPSTPTGYAFPNEGNPKESFTSIMMFGGIGASYPAGPVNIFADASIAIPANRVNGEYVEVNIDSHLIFNVGIRIPFGKPDFDY